LKGLRVTTARQLKCRDRHGGAPRRKDAGHLVLLGLPGKRHWHRDWPWQLRGTWIGAHVAATVAPPASVLGDSDADRASKVQVARVPAGVYSRAQPGMQTPPGSRTVRWSQTVKAEY
jgi:hypothetical protein